MIGLEEKANEYNKLLNLFVVDEGKLISKTFEIFSNCDKRYISSDRKSNLPIKNNYNELFIKDNNLSKLYRNSKVVIGSQKTPYWEFDKFK